MADPLLLRPDPAIRWVWWLRGAGLTLALFPFLAWPILFPLGSFLRTLGVPFWLSFLFAGALLFTGVLVATIVWSMNAWWRTRATLEPDALVLERGWIMRSRTRIRNADLRDLAVVRGPLLRAFGLGTVRLPVRAGPDRSWWTIPGQRDPEAVARTLAARAVPPPPSVTAPVSLPERSPAPASPAAVPKRIPRVPPARPVAPKTVGRAKGKAPRK